jgi:hypothetical protein
LKEGERSGVGMKKEGERREGRRRREMRCNHDRICKNKG